MGAWRRSPHSIKGRAGKPAMYAVVRRSSPIRQGRSQLPSPGAVPAAPLTHAAGRLDYRPPLRNMRPGQERQQQPDDQGRGGEPMHPRKVVRRRAAVNVRLGRRPLPSGAPANPPQRSARRRGATDPLRTMRRLDPGARDRRTGCRATPLPRRGAASASTSCAPARGRGPARQPRSPRWPPGDPVRRGN